MKTRFAIGAAVLTVVFLGPAVTRTTLGAADGRPQSRAALGQAPQPSAGMGDMAKMHEQMMAEMKAADARLDALVLDMNMASGEAQLAAVVAVVNELVRERKAMSGRMEQMHHHMTMGGGQAAGQEPKGAHQH